MITVIIILISVLIITGVILYTHTVIRRKRDEKAGIVPEPPASEIPDDCCGQHAVCERDSLLAAASKEIVYYDDEELDEWQGTPADQYSEEQCAHFRDILYTMRSDEVAGWVRSLQLRGIELPNEIKDEVLLIVGERRFH